MVIEFSCSQLSWSILHCLFSFFLSWLLRPAHRLSYTTCALSCHSSLLQLRELWTESGGIWWNANTSWNVREEKGASNATIHQVLLFTVWSSWASILVSSPLTRPCSRGSFYIYVLSHLCRSLASNVQALHPPNLSFSLVLQFGSWKPLTVL